MESVKEIVLSLSLKLPYYYESHMPYTYHHDQIREEMNELYKSRSDVASAFIDATDDHLFSIAFYHLLQSHDGVDAVKNLNAEDLKNAYRIINIAEFEMSKLES